MSLLNILKKRHHKDLFTTPSHSQKFFIFNKFAQFYKYDISETDTHNPELALSLAQKRASEIYGSKSTFFLTNGSSSGIIAAVLSCVKRGEEVLLWSGAHPSHKSAVKLAGGVPVFYEIKKDLQWGVFKKVDVLDLKEKIVSSNIKALIVTSPSYEGFVSDISALSKICKENNVFLIVDEAHGALYPFSKELPYSAIYQGADFVIQSLHKTAAGLNPTALLHVNAEVDIESALGLISTTSPSYPLLASIEKNINFLNSKKGKRYINELLINIENLKKNVKTVEFCSNDDITKILIKKTGMSGPELSEFLFENGIEDERTNDESTMLLCGIGTDLKKLIRLEKVLKKL